MNPRRRPNAKRMAHAPGQPASQAGHPSASQIKSKALALSDGRPIRNKIKKEYDKAQGNLQRARGELDRFHREDRPSYDQWFHKTFGALITQLRDCQRKAAEAEWLVRQVDAEVYFTGCSYGEAYRRVIYRRDHPEPPPDDSGPDRDPNDPFTRRPDSSDPSSSEADEVFEDAMNDFEDLLNGIFGGQSGRRRGNRHRERDRSGHWGDAGGRQDREAHRPRRLKELYRELVRRLHPDRHRELSGQRLEWWHQVQAAYQVGDAEQMEIILALCEIEDSGHTNTTSLSILQRITRQLKKALRDLKAQISRLKKEPAWNFSRRTDLEALKTKVGIQMESDLWMVQDRLKHVEAMIEDWKSEAARPGRKRRGSGQSRRRRVDPFEFLFD